MAAESAINRGWTERLRRREATIAGQNDRGYLFEAGKEFRLDGSN
jgi:hypothetical protein